MAEMEDTLEKVAIWLVIIGGLNWGLVGVGAFAGTDLNVVGLLLGGFANGIVANIVYVIVGLSALWVLKGQFTKA